MEEAKKTEYVARDLHGFCPRAFNEPCEYCSDRDSCVEETKSVVRVNCDGCAGDPYLESCKYRACSVHLAARAQAAYGLLAGIYHECGHQSRMLRR